MAQLLTKSADQRIILQGTWEKFKLMQQVSEDSPGVRLAFYDGEIEVFMPGREHELFGCVIGGLLLIYLAVTSGSIVASYRGWKTSTVTY